MMRLYGLCGACSLAVHIVLKWMDVPFEPVKLELTALVRDDYLALNPLFLPGRFVDDVSQHEGVRRKAAIRLRGLFERAGAQLAGQYWLTGHRSIADPYLFVMLR